MKVFRFMSKDEFEKYKRGEVLKNNTIHNCQTTSVGFCFLKLDDFEPSYAYHFLSGIVSYEVCVVFETTKELKKTQGKYAVPFSHATGFFDSFIADEYCIDSYSKDDFKLLKYSYDFNKKHWLNEEWTWLEEGEE